MPTGYTAGILDGEIKNISDFAKVCMRNFGACMHLRDDSLTEEYKPRVPSDYHSKEIKKAKQLIYITKKLSDTEIVLKENIRLNESKKYHLETLEKQKIQLELIGSILEDVKDWTPPTSEHDNLKSFMIQQIESTIDFDFSGKYHEDALIKIESDLLNINAIHLRSSIIEQAEKDLKYHSEKLQQEVKSCELSNKWVTDLLSSLP